MWARRMIKSLRRKVGCCFPLYSPVIWAWTRVVPGQGCQEHENSEGRGQWVVVIWPISRCQVTSLPGLRGLCSGWLRDGQCQESSGAGSHSTSWSLSPGPCSPLLKQLLTSGFFNLFGTSSGLVAFTGASYRVSCEDKLMTGYYKQLLHSRSSGEEEMRPWTEQNFEKFPCLACFPMILPI